MQQYIALAATAALFIIPAELFAQLDTCTHSPLRFNLPARISVGGCVPGSNFDILHILNDDVSDAWPVLRITSPVNGQQPGGLAQIGFNSNLSSIAAGNDLVMRVANFDSVATYDSGDIILSANHKGAAIRFATYDSSLTRDVECMTITSDQMVGINTNMPSHALSVMALTDQSAIEFGYDGHVGRLYANADNFGFRNSVDSTLLAINQENGKVGIGTDEPESALDVRNGAVSIDNDSWYKGRNNAGTGRVQLIKVGTNNHVYVGHNKPVHLAHNGGNVAIGDVNSPSEALVVDGNIVPKSDSIYSIGTSQIRWNKGWSKNGWETTSDIRLKDNVEDLRYGLAEVLQLQSISYTWKDETGGRRYLGLIAQELLEHLSEAVTVPENPEEPLSVDYADVIPVLVKAIQEQQAIIEKQAEALQRERQRNDAQQAALDAIHSRLAVLERATGDPSRFDRQSGDMHGGEPGGAMLYPGQPNPFDDETQIRFFVPEKVQAASLLIYETVSGRSVRRVPIRQRGSASLRVSAEGLQSGSYTCRLVADGKVVGSNTIVVLK